MFNWQSIETYPKPVQMMDLDYPQAMFYSQEQGIVIGRCYFHDFDEEPYTYQYGNGDIIKPTHWMPLPKNPGLEEVSSSGPPPKLMGLTNNNGKLDWFIIGENMSRWIEWRCRQFPDSTDGTIAAAVIRSELASTIARCLESAWE